MKFFLPLLMTLTLFSQEMTHPPSPVISEAHSKSILVIDPKTRSTDLIQAFDHLRKDKPTLKITLKIASGFISNITDLSTTTGGTLLLVRSLSNQGSKMQVVPIEEVMEINYSP